VDVDNVWRLCFSRAGISCNSPVHRLGTGSSAEEVFQREETKMNYKAMEMLCRLYRTGKITRSMFVLKWSQLQREAGIKCA